MSVSRQARWRRGRCTRPKGLAAKRELELFPGGREAARRRFRAREREPAVAAETPVPAHTVLLAGEDRVLRPQLGCVHTQELVPANPAHEELVVEPRHEAARLLRPGRLRGHEATRETARSTASSGVDARSTPSICQPGSRITTGRPSVRAKPISASVPHRPPTAITASPLATAARLRAWPIPVTTTWSIHSFASACISPGRIPIVVPPADFAPRAAAPMTSPRPPQTTVQPRSARSRPTCSARSSCSAPLPITATCIAVPVAWRQDEGLARRTPARRRRDGRSDGARRDDGPRRRRLPGPQLRLRPLRPRGEGVPHLRQPRAPAGALPLLPQRPGPLARRPHARLRARAAADRPLCAQRRRLPGQQLPHPDAPGRPPLRPRRAPDARPPARLPAAVDRPRLLGRLRARA